MIVQHVSFIIIIIYLFQIQMQKMDIIHFMKKLNAIALCVLPKESSFFG